MIYNLEITGDCDARRRKEYGIVRGIKVRTALSGREIVVTWHREQVSRQDSFEDWAEPL